MRGAVVAVGAPTVGPCEQNFPSSDCIDDSVPNRIPSSHPDSEGADEDADGEPDEDQNSLLPRWLPDTSQGRGWLARVRADPGRAGAIGLAIVAALAVLVTVFTLMRDRPAPVMSAKLPPVEKRIDGKPAGRRQVRVPASRPVRTDRWWSAWSAWCTPPGWSPWRPARASPMRCRPPAVAVNGADTIGLNMARPLGDGEQIVVGLAPVSGQPTALGSSVASGSTAISKPSTPGPGPGSGSVKPKAGEVLDLNTATVEQLDALPGVGPVTAAAIVAWRQANGKFTSVDQLADVDGIGPARLDKLRALVRV